jgi:hypothetical protein
MDSFARDDVDTRRHAPIPKHIAPDISEPHHITICKSTLLPPAGIHGKGTGDRGQ